MRPAQRVPNKDAVPWKIRRFLACWTRHGPQRTTDSAIGHIQVMHWAETPFQSQPAGFAIQTTLLLSGWEFDDGLHEFAGEFEGHLFRVVLADRRAGVLAAVECLVE